jgi:diguanylate cyclase (GGDEF)-like protein
VAQRGGDFVARYGGEEFSVILSNTDDTGGATVAENVRAKVQSLIVLVAEGVCVQMTVSVGVIAS